MFDDYEELKNYYDVFGHLPSQMNGKKDYQERIEATMILATKHSSPQKIIITNNSRTQSKEGEPLDKNTMLKMSITAFYMLGFASAAAFGLAGLDPTGEIIPSIPDRFTIGGILTALLGAIWAMWKQSIKERIIYQNRLKDMQNEHRNEMQSTQKQITELIAGNQKSIVDILMTLNTKKDK